MATHFGRDSRLVSTEQVFVKVVEWWNDEDRDTRIFQISSETFNLLKKYIDKGDVDEEIYEPLRQALSECPLWNDLTIHGLDITQRKVIVGIFIIENYEEIEGDYQVEVFRK